MTRNSENKYFAHFYNFHGFDFYTEIASTGDEFEKNTNKEKNIYILHVSPVGLVGQGMFKIYVQVYYPIKHGQNKQ